MTGITKFNDNSLITKEYFGTTTIDAFIASRHCSKNTTRTYRNSIRQLQKFFASKSITTPTTADVDAFISELRTAKKSDSTLRLYWTTTKLYFSFLEKRGVYHDVAADCEPLKLRKAKTHKKEALTDEQAKALLNAVKGDSLIALRDKAVIALCLTCGLRTCEVSRANVGDFKDAGSYWTLAVTGKGHQTADEKVKVSLAVVELIQSYLDKRGNVDDDEPLFASTSNNNSKYGNRYSEQSVGKMIKRMMIKVGIAKPTKKDKNGRIKRSPISAHSTRHSAATCAINKKCDIREVSAMLRHSSLVVTSIYLHDISLKTRRAELAVADVLFCA